jgi:hypothetical protein
MLALCTALTVLAAPVGATTPDMALALRAGTTGIDLDYDIALASSLSARVGYSGFNYSHSVDTSDVDYNGRLKLSMVSGLLDWYVFHGGFRLSAGVVGDGGTRLDLTGKPAINGSYTVNGDVYTSGDVGSVSGRLKFGHTVSPYVGLGWGDAVGAQHHWHFLFDIGAIYGGTPNVVLNVACGPEAPSGSATCNKLQTDVQTEVAKLQSDVNVAKWYPVIDLGVAYRF